MNPCDTTTADGAERSSSVERTPRDQGGFVLPWIALMLLVLIAMAGFGVDVWNWWYTAQKVQRAADAGALAGVAFMPANFNGTAPSATSVASSIVSQNGFSSATVAQGAKSNQLVVTVSQTVDNYFTSLLGLKTTTISRSATAEFNAPVSMGSPAGHLGNDPDNGAADQHWLNIGAPGVDKRTGDQYADYDNCSSGTYNCSSGINTDYSDDSYVFTVDIPTVPAGGVDIQAYDPEYANGHTSCNNDPMNSVQISSLVALGANYTDAATRYAGSQNNYCTGDDETNLGTPQSTAWLVYSGGTAPLFDESTQPVVATGNSSGGPCAHQFKGYSPNGKANESSYWFDLLNSANSTTYDADFYKSFHRWYTLCHVTTAGRYFVQVRSSVPFSATQQNSVSYLQTRTQAPASTGIAGQNRYSLRAANGGTNTVTSGAATYAQARLPIYTNTTGANTPNFYLARMLPGGGSTGRVLALTFFDVGDLASGTSTKLVVSPPSDATGSAITCSNWTFNGSTGNAAPSGSTFSGCTLDGITSNTYPGGYNGVRVDVDVNVPGDYNCTTGSSTGCWFKIQMFYAGGSASQANDTTTWSASIGGDPVRLVK